MFFSPHEFYVGFDQPSPTTHARAWYFKAWVYLSSPKPLPKKQRGSVELALFFFGGLIKRGALLLLNFTMIYLKSLVFIKMIVW